MAGLGGGRRQGIFPLPLLASTIFMLILIGSILNGVVFSAPVMNQLDIRGAAMNGNRSGHDSLDIVNESDRPKTEDLSWTEDTGNGPPSVVLPDFVIDNLNQVGNRTKHGNSSQHPENNELHENSLPLVVIEYQPGLVIRCAGKGVPKPNVTWELEGATLPHYVVLTGLTYSQNQTKIKEEGDMSWVDLRLPKLNNAFYGKLRCKTENQFGNSTWEMEITPNANSSVLMKIVRCTFASVLLLLGILVIKTIMWLDVKRKDRLYEKLPSQDLEIIKKFKKGLPPPLPSPSSSIVPSTNCVASAVEITVTADDGTSSNDPTRYGYRLVKQGSSSPELEKRFGNSRNGGASSPTTSCVSVHVYDWVNSWTNYVAYDDKLETSSQHFKVDPTKILENGTYGMIFEGQIRNDLTMKWSTVAVKTGKTERDDNFLLESILTELKILASLPKIHEHIVNLRGAYTKMLHKRQAYVFVDICENGILANFIDLNRNNFNNLLIYDATIKSEEQETGSNSNKHTTIEISSDKGLIMAVKSAVVNDTLSDSDREVGSTDKGKTAIKFSTKELISWAWQIADGMNFLHKHRVIHGNLSTSNVYVTKDLKVKIGNIGYPPAEESLESIDATTKKWLTVPNFSIEQFSKKSDVWDYGRTLWEIFSLREQQCPDMRDIQAFFRSEDGEIEIPDYASSDIFEILLCCWNDEGTLRPEFDFFLKVFKHVYRSMFSSKNKAGSSISG